VELDLQWLLIGLPLAFALGWLGSRLDLRQLKRERDDSPRAYFKGLNLLLSEQQDQAIDAFIQAVQNDPDTTELHFALGNLFRRRGEFERAVRVHQHLLQRADLKASERDRAQLALAQDYTKAGLFDRAEGAWRALLNTPHRADARLALLSLYERSRDWANAAMVARELQAEGGTADYRSRIAHHECEVAEALDAKGDTVAADAALARSREAAPAAARPLVLAGQRHRRAGRHAEAVAAWDELRALQPIAFLLVAPDYAASAQAAGLQEPARQALEGALQSLPAIELLQALAPLEGATPAERLPRLLQHLKMQPTLSAAQLLFSVPHESWTDEARAALRDAVARAAKPLQRYRCANCGFEAQHYFWQCPGCLAWDSYPPQRIDQ
jgi:lipopolysaccharide assembly protein B